MKNTVMSVVAFLSIALCSMSTSRAQCTGPTALCPYPDTTLSLPPRPACQVSVCGLVPQVIANGCPDVSTHGCMVRSGPGQINGHCGWFRTGVSVIACDAYSVDHPEIPADICTFTLTVFDPLTTVNCPADMVIGVTDGQTSANIDYTVTGNPTPVCVPPSGSSFPLGTTTVTCTATGDCDPVSCSFSVTIIEATPVAIDIKPGSCPNPLSAQDKGLVSVAIMGTSTFDATQVDPATIRLEGIAPVHWALEDAGGPYSPYLGKTNCTDCNTERKDRVTDLTLKFDAQALLEALAPVTNDECRVLHLIAGLFGGGAVLGEDVVSIHTLP